MTVKTFHSKRALHKRVGPVRDAIELFDDVLKVLEVFKVVMGRVVGDFAFAQGHVATKRAGGPDSREQVKQLRVSYSKEKEKAAIDSLGGIDNLTITCEHLMQKINHTITGQQQSNGAGHRVENAQFEFLAHVNDGFWRRRRPAFWLGHERIELATHLDLVGKQNTRSQSS